jgi:2-desacetyl-2-hydroxyethyl bacteriochlorophyllide A dehydrogenase
MGHPDLERKESKMKAVVTSLLPDGRRQKGLVGNWPDVGPVTGNLIKTRTLFSGVTNGTERNDLIRGNYAHADKDLPAPWGYQNVGEVIEVGPDVKNVQVGDVVYSSQDHLEYALFPEGWLFIKLPEEVDRKQAALFGMASVAMRTCRNTGAGMGSRVLVVGGGFIGQMAAQILRAMGARPTLCDINEKRLERARKIGACEKVFNSGGDGWRQNAEDFSFDAVIDVAGVPGMENDLISVTRVRGTIVFVAGRDQITYSFNHGQWHEIVIKQNGHFDQSDLENLCRLVVNGQVQIAPFVQDVVPVAESLGIYEKLRDTPGELMGTVFAW